STEGHPTSSNILCGEESISTYCLSSCKIDVCIMEPDKSGGPWQTKATIHMQTSENALTVRMITLL
ncbi:hypothetical protein S83_066588, partial [Arachis hypogaea]